LDTPDAISKLWHKETKIIRAFIDVQHRYDKLCQEVAYILSQQLRSVYIEYAAITSRAKSLNSFCEKITRKSYKSPLKEITDLAGVRIVYLYLADMPRIEEIMAREFTIIERNYIIDKADPDHFGYGALHYLVNLGKSSSGARYDDLKDLVCEVQVRTVLQDAWALIAHHLSYKHESDVPIELRRKLNALAGLFETADDQFDRLRTDRQIYKERIRKELSQKQDKFIEPEINFDNLTEYLTSRLADRGPSSVEDIANLLSELKKFDYTKLSQIDKALQRTSTAIQAYESEHPPYDPELDEPCRYSPVGAVRLAMSFTNNDYLNTTKTFKELIPEFSHLVV